jgi:hypothetical protein
MYIVSSLKIQCAHCHKLILLPPHRPGRTPPYRSWSPEAGRSGNVLCPACKHVCAYSRESVRPELLAPDQVGVLPKRFREVWYFEASCGNKGCSAVRILLPVDATSVSELLIARGDLMIGLYGAKLEGVVCTNEHPCNEVRLPVFPKQDVDWECALGTPPEEML